VGASSSSIPGNGATKLVGGAVMIVWKMCSKWLASWKTPREGFDEYSSKFSLS
jgi:hypothetical protein